MGIGVIVFSIFLFYLIGRDLDRADLAKRWASDNGCTYIGRARDLNSVAFFKCGDEIKLKHIQIQ